MQNDTISDANNLEAEVRNAVEQGRDVQEIVRKLTLRRISSRSLDVESMRQIAAAVLRGAKAGAQKNLQHSAAQNDVVRASLKQAVTGLDVAFAQLAEALKLAVEEAAGRAQKYSKEDLALARRDMESMETMFLEALQSSAVGARDAAGDILHDLAAHARNNGSALGAQLKETLAVITHQIGVAGQAQVGAGLHLARSTADLLRQIAAGVLTGVADHVRPGHSGNKGD